MKITTIKFIPFLGKLIFTAILAVSGVAVASAQGSGWPTTSINITGFSFTPSTIDTTNGSQTITVTVRVTDTERDFWQMNVYFISPQSHTIHGFGGSNLGIEDRISGDGRDGVYQKTVTIHQYAEAGAWEVSSIDVYDGTLAYYRWRRFYTSDLVARGFATQLQVINTNEAVPPEISEFSFTPIAINPINSARDVTIALRARDQASGVSSIRVSFSNPPGCYLYDEECVTLFSRTITGADRISGDDRDGVYRVVVTVSQNFPMGTYHAGITAQDAVQNYMRLSSSDLAALGYPTQLRIESDPVPVTNLEELYSAVNNPQNGGRQIIIAPGVYMLSVSDPNGVARPNSGRIELQENMSLQGFVGDRGAVIIDAINLPLSSFNNAAPVTLTAAIRMGLGTNAIEWLTVRNAINGNANIGTELASTTTNIRVAHVASTNSQRGMDVRNFGVAQAGRVLNAEIFDNDFYNNRVGLVGAGLRIVNNQRANGGIINATLAGNRSYDNYVGLLVENNQSSSAMTTVSSSGNRFFENGAGAIVGGGLSQGMNAANGNTVNFRAYGDVFENNNGFNNFDFGGLVIPGGENTSFPNGTSDNTVTAVLRGCRFANNQIHDLAAFGARSSPASIGMPGTNNRVNIRLYSTGVPVLVSDDSIPDSPGGMNSVVISRPSLDFDNDGRTDISVFRPSNRTWYLQGGTSGYTTMQYGEAGDLITPADYDGDGKTDIAVFRPSTGQWYVVNSSNGTFLTYNWGADGDLPVPTDRNGDGKADLIIFRPSTSTWYSSSTTTGPFGQTQFGVTGDKPVAGDFDADGIGDIAVFRPSNRNWYILKSSQGFFVQTWGEPGDIQAPADFNGDGATDLAVFRPSTGQWFLNLSGGGFTNQFWGQAGDIPVPADYDGDGVADVAVFRPANGTWYIVRSTAGILQVPFGQTGDVPTQSSFIY